LVPSGGGHAIGRAEGSRMLGDGRCAVISGGQISVTAEIRIQMRRRRKSHSSATACIRRARYKRNAIPQI
jgi:hypothetical protein